ncbi:NADP-dependent oxidoreductase domain-containing protein [Lipomyces kononenkoae]|uniref:NADP-dependent oxidoreductase domain-containing protein n=1 Tax=Lipomyces kononenkoae TaxID=34357 RepID=A0ACC3T3P8_LIPKO
MPLPTTQLGKEGPQVTSIGFGAMGISAFYGSKLEDDAAFAVLDKALELGCTFWDTARLYNDNEDVIGRWFKKTGKRSEIFLCTKFGVKPDDYSADGSPEYVKSSCEESLRRLGIETIDLFYQHRMDPSLPIEVTVGAMAELVKEGKVRYLGLSECSAATLRRAHAVHPITAVQIEYSPFAIEAQQNGLLDACEELGVAVVAYSPLSRGFLTGAYTKPEDFDENDFRRFAPRFQKENFDANLKLLAEFKDIAAKKDATPGQVALSWLIAKGAIPIPGTTKIARLEENVKAAHLELTKAEVEEINEFVENADVAGDRYPSLNNLYADTPELK